MPRRRLVILGSGFAAFSLVRTIDRRSYDVTIVSPRNHFLFTPLLPGTTVGTVEFRSIVEPVRGWKEITYVQGEAAAILAEKQAVVCRSTFDGSSFLLDYDVLVLAVGTSVNTYGIPGVAEYAYPLKELADARAIRREVVDRFEHADQPGLAPEERKRLLHFVVAGGGPTGVEFAAELHDFVRRDVRRAFPRLVEDVRITLLEAAPQILNTFDAVLAAYAVRHFARQQIIVRTNAPVVKVDAHAIVLADEHVIPYGLLVWSAGTGPTEFVRSLPFTRDFMGRIIADDQLHVEGYGQIFAAGDCSVPRSMIVPATAQVAQQEGTYVGRVLNAQAHGRKIAAFRYRHFGMLAYIGSQRALADLSSVKGRGYVTWVFWRSAYLTKLVSMKNKILVLFDWFKSFLFGRDVSRF